LIDGSRYLDAMLVRFTRRSAHRNLDLENPRYYRRVSLGGSPLSSAAGMEPAATAIVRRRDITMSITFWAAPAIALGIAIGLACWWFWRPARSQLRKATLIAALDVYQTAWEQQDSELLLTIFTQDAVYHERLLEEPMRGHEAIAAYWQEKVVKGQGRISFTLLNTYIAGTIGIAEWEVYFDDCVQRKRKHMKEIAILEFLDGKIASLREYWTSEVIAEL
jgi:ketosteroid isomerase-like protein